MGGRGPAMPVGGRFDRNQEGPLLVWQHLEPSHLLPLQQERDPKNVFAESRPAVTVQPLGDGAGTDGVVISCQAVSLCACGLSCKTL